MFFLTERREKVDLNGVVECIKLQIHNIMFGRIKGNQEKKYTNQSLLNPIISIIRI